MLHKFESRTVFVIFCAVTLVLVGMEIFVIYEVSRNPSWGQGAALLINSGFLAGCGLIFQQIVRTNFLSQNRVSSLDLHQYLSARSSILSRSYESAATDEFLLRTALITNTLKFGERILRGWISATHIELCVFVDKSQPLMISYFDSALNEKNRSMVDREKSHSYYQEKRYEAVKLLNEPDTMLRTISDTAAEDVGYSFARPEQNRQLRSTALLCLDLGFPSVLVVTSNETGAFDNDSELETFLKSIGESVRADLLDNGFAFRIRDLRPKLFS